MDEATKFAKVLEGAQKKRLEEHSKSCGVCKSKGPDTCIIRAAIVRHMEAKPVSKQ